MFSAFKKLTTKDKEGNNGVSPTNVQSMSKNLQNKFAKVNCSCQSACKVTILFLGL